MLSLKMKAFDAHIAPVLIPVQQQNSSFLLQYKQTKIKQLNDIGARLNIDMHSPSTKGVSHGFD